MRLLFTLTLCCVTLIFSAKVGGQIITTVAGNGITGYTGDGGLAINAELNQPVDVNFDASGNMYIADSRNNVVRKVNAKTGIIATIVGNGTQGFSGDSGLATQAQLYLPSNVVVDKKNNIYINEWGNLRIRKIDAKTGIITTIAGGGSSKQDTVLATDASIFPEGIALDKKGNTLYIVETIGGGRIRKIDPLTGILYTLINPHYPFENDSYYGSELALDSANNIYISCNDSRIRRIDALTNTVTIVAGNGISGYNGDGDFASKTEFNLPQGVQFDDENNFYIADYYNSRLRKITESDSIVNTIAGNGNPAYNADSIFAINAQLSLWGIRVNAKGEIYVADLDNNRIRKISPESVLAVRLTFLTAQKQNNSAFLQWQTANEINNSYFGVERSPDSKLFYSIGTKQGLNKGGINNYSFVDNAPLKGMNYYRLKQVDKDGKYSYSGIASVEFLNDGSLFTIAPNPANDNITITIPKSNSASEIVIYDVTGKKTLQEEIAANILQNK